MEKHQGVRTFNTNSKTSPKYILKATDGCNWILCHEIVKTRAIWNITELIDYDNKYTQYLWSKYWIFVHKIFVEISGMVFQQTIGIPMDINCAQMLSDFI